MHVHVVSRVMTSPLTHPASHGRWTPRLWGTLLGLCAAMFLDALDVSMVGVALPSIGSELDLSTSTLQWIVSGYILGYGGAPLPRGPAARPPRPPPALPPSPRGFPAASAPPPRLRSH